MGAAKPYRRSLASPADQGSARGTRVAVASSDDGNKILAVLEVNDFSHGLGLNPAEDPLVEAEKCPDKRSQLKNSK